MAEANAERREILAGEERAIQWLGPDTCQQRGVTRIGDLHQPESSRVPKDDSGSIIQRHDNVLMACLLVRRIGRQAQEAPAHAEVHDPRSSVVEAEQEVLRTAVRADDGLAEQCGFEARRECLSQIAPPHVDGHHSSADDKRADGAADRLYFRQFRHYRRAVDGRSKTKARRLPATRSRVAASARCLTPLARFARFPVPIAR